MAIANEMNLFSLPFFFSSPLSFILSALLLESIDEFAYVTRSALLIHHKVLVPTTVPNKLGVQRDDTESGGGKIDKFSHSFSV